jgi:hypothetical protein
VARIAQGLGEGDGLAASLGLVIADDNGAEHGTTVRLGSAHAIGTLPRARSVALRSENFPWPLIVMGFWGVGLMVNA